MEEKIFEILKDFVGLYWFYEILKDFFKRLFTIKIYNTDFNGFIIQILMDFNGLYGFLGFQMIQWIFTDEVIIAFPLKNYYCVKKIIAKFWHWVEEG